MAYPRGQFQQPPSNPSYGNRQPPYVQQQQQQQQQQYNYQQVPSSRNRNDRPYQDFPSQADTCLPEPLHIEPNYNSLQWQEQSAQWSSEAEQPYSKHREYAGHTSSHMRPRQGEYQGRMDEFYVTGGPSAGPPYSHDQDPSWSRQSPQMTGPPQQFHQSREHGSSPHLTNDYDGAGPAVRMNGHHAPGAAQNSNVISETVYHDSPGKGGPWGQSAQQQSSRPAQDVRSKNAVWAQGARDPQAQQHAPELRNGKPKKPTKGKLHINPMSPEIISWDNPFPTFPKNNKKNNRPREKDLIDSMASSSITDRSTSRQAGSNMPAAVDKQNNSDPSRNAGQPYPQRQPQDRIVRDDQALDREPAGGPTVPGPQHGFNPHQPAFDQAVTSQEGRRPQTDYGRHSEDRSNYAFNDSGAYQQNYQRSKTMPNTISQAMTHSQPPKPQGRQMPMHHMQHRSNGQSDRVYRGPPQPQISTTTTYPRSQSFENSGAQRYQNAHQWDPQPPSHSQHSQQSSFGDFFDSYYHSPHHSDPNFAQRHAGQPRSPPEEDMPNFDNIPASESSHRRGLTIDNHLQPQQRAPALPPMPSQPVASSRSPPIPPAKAGFAHSKSSPNLRQPNPQQTQQYSDGFDFELPGSVPAMYSPGPSPSSDNYQSTNPNDRLRQRPWPHNAEGRPHPSSARPVQATSRPGTDESHTRQPFPRPPDGQSRPSMSRGTPSQDSHNQVLRNGPSPVRRYGPTSPPVYPQSKPDSLPAHPAPVRAGLISSPPTNQSSRPAPVRQYSAGLSSLPQTSSNPRPQISRPPAQKNESVAITHEGLERLRQTTRRNPSDNQTQLLLAKKLVEAASVLADEGGRADAKTASKNRERFNSEAYKLVKKLAQNGYPEATFYLGDCYTRGLIGLEIDPKEAFNQYQSAAKAGHAQAAYRVAVCCEMGLEEGGGTKRDAVKAMQWYQRAATLGDTPAMYKMGVIQLKGLLGQSKSAPAALSWLQRAAKQADNENPHAVHELALLYESPTAIEGLRKDEEHAKQLFFEAANLGYKFSQFRLGCAFEYGLLGCPIDPRQSIAWYSKAAVQDEHQSELALSGWYLTGSEGVIQQSDTEAYLWARKAAQAGLAKAEYAMGYFTEVGIGAPANLEDAKRWYWRSASQNFPKAKERLEDLRRGGAKMQKTRVSRSKINKQSEGECVVM